MIRRATTKTLLVPASGRRWLSLASNSSSASSSSSAGCQLHQVPPLSHPLPNLPEPIYPNAASLRDDKTRVTVMKNGLRVASQKKFGQFCIAGVAINSGSRLEACYPSGVSHFLERSAFKSTNKFHGREHIMENLALYGGTVDCQGSRDLMIYAVSVVNRHLEVAVELLGETVLRPKLTQEEVNETASRISFELQDMSFDPERRVQLTEMIHKAAYGNHTLGLPKVCPSENIGLINPSIMFNYLKHNHTFDKMVLAGVGVEHEQLVELAQKYFVDMPANWHTDPSLASPQPTQVERIKSQYTGGIVKIEEDLSNVSLGPTPLPNLVHFLLGFQVAPHLELDEFVVVCVMNMLMGGGGSFSAGGPGKGMFTRLFTNILNRYHWIHSSAAHNSSYEDSGIFYIQSSSDPHNLRNLVHVIIGEFRNLAHGRIYDEELNRAKKQLISMLWLNLEIRPVVFEDVARQVLSAGFRRQPRQLIEKIQQVTADDIRRVASAMISKNPSVACLGDLSGLPTHSEIVDKIQAPH